MLTFWSLTQPTGFVSWFPCHSQNLNGLTYFSHSPWLSGLAFWSFWQLVAHTSVSMQHSLLMLDLVDSEALLCCWWFSLAKVTILSLVQGKISVDRGESYFCDNSYLYRSKKFRLILGTFVLMFFIITVSYRDSLFSIFILTTYPEPINTIEGVAKLVSTYLESLESNILPFEE